MISWSFGLFAACGAALGMSVSYTLGRHLGPRVQNLPLLRSRPAVMRRAGTLFGRYGFAAILLDYFSGPLRAVTACVAAISGMRRAKFEVANVTSAALRTLGAAAVGAVPGALIAPGSSRLPIGLVLVPAATVGISVVIKLLRARPVPRCPAGDDAART